MILANQIIGKLDSILESKIKVMDFCKTFQVFQKQLIFYLKERNPGNLEEINKVLAFYVEKHNKEINREIDCSPEERFKNYRDVFKSIMENVHYVSWRYVSTFDLEQHGGK